jgi:nitrite reductase/ring-hydroxylating ferredoxin subunit
MSPAGSVKPSLIFHTDLPESGLAALEVEIAGETESIIVHRDGNRLSAWRNACPHQGRRLDYVPGKFLIDGNNLVCAAHGASFRLADGVCVAGPCRGERLQALCLTPAGADWLVSHDPPGPGGSTG